MYLKGFPKYFLLLYLNNITYVYVILQVMCIHPSLALVKVAVTTNYMWYVVANDYPSVNDLIDPQFRQYFGEELRQHRMKTIM